MLTGMSNYLYALNSMLIWKSSSLISSCVVASGGGSLTIKERKAQHQTQGSMQ